MTRLLGYRERQVLEHATALNHPLGLRLYRNRFLAGPDHEDWDVLQALVSHGYLAADDVHAEVTTFTVTPAGLEALGR